MVVEHCLAAIEAPLLTERSAVIPQSARRDNSGVGLRALSVEAGGAYAVCFGIDSRVREDFRGGSLGPGREGKPFDPL